MLSKQKQETIHAQEQETIHTGTGNYTHTGTGNYTHTGTRYKRRGGLHETPVVIVLKSTRQPSGYNL